MFHRSDHKALTLTAVALLLAVNVADAQENKSGAGRAVPELNYRVTTDFFHAPAGTPVGEASGVALNSKGHIFLFQRVAPMLSEYDEHGVYLRSLGDGLFGHPHGLRIDDDDNLWTTDDGSHLVLKLSPTGQVLLVLDAKVSQQSQTGYLISQPTSLLGRAGRSRPRMGMATHVSFNSIVKGNF
jgi:hypothetical protein